jgi:hypothetical protein
VWNSPPAGRATLAPVVAGRFDGRMLTMTSVERIQAFADAAENWD